MTTDAKICAAITHGKWTPLWSFHVGLRSVWCLVGLNCAVAKHYFQDDDWNDRAQVTVWVPRKGGLKMVRCFGDPLLSSRFNVDVKPAFLGPQSSIMAVVVNEAGRLGLVDALSSEFPCFSPACGSVLHTASPEWPVAVNQVAASEQVIVTWLTDRTFRAYWRQGADFIGGGVIGAPRPKGNPWMELMAVLAECPDSRAVNVHMCGFNCVHEWRLQEGADIVETSLETPMNFQAVMSRVAASGHVLKKDDDGYWPRDGGWMPGVGLVTLLTKHSILGGQSVVIGLQGISVSCRRLAWMHAVARANMRVNKSHTLSC